MKCRSRIARCRETDFTVMMIDNSLADVQLQPGAAQFLRVRGIGLREFSKNPTLESFGDSGTVVVDKNPYFGPLAEKRYLDLAIFWREFYGVRQ